MMNRQIFKLLRTQQYIKNFFVFAPLLFSFTFEPKQLLNSLLAFGLFCMVASSIYVLNDLMDIAEDRQHPTKKNRPLASGAVNTSTAYLLIAILGVGSLALSLIISPPLFAVLLGYFTLNVCYSLGLKHIAIIDIFIIAVGFVLRLFAGNVFLPHSLSMWIIIITFLLAIFLAIAKRRDDVLLAQQGQKTRKNVDGYNLEFVNAAMTFMSAVIIVCYIQYSISPAVVERIGSPHLYLTSIFVILGILRYMQLTFVENKSGSPTKIVVQDRFLQITIAVWLGSFFTIYFTGNHFG